jgi:general secretion pathway protein D
MKTHRSWALAMTLALPGLALAADPALPCNSSSSASESGIDISDLIDKVAKRTGKQFIIDPRVRDVIPKTGLDVDKVDYARLLAILTVHQYAAYESNGVVKIVPDANARQLPIPAITEIPAKTLDDEFVMVLFQAKNMCSAYAVPVLRPLMPQARAASSTCSSGSTRRPRPARNARRSGCPRRATPGKVVSVSAPRA